MNDIADELDRSNRLESCDAIALACRGAAEIRRLERENIKARALLERWGSGEDTPELDGDTSAFLDALK
jgi:hypothetical protein